MLPCFLLFLITSNPTMHIIMIIQKPSIPPTMEITKAALVPFSAVEVVGELIAKSIWQVDCVTLAAFVASTMILVFSRPDIPTYITHTY